MVTVLCLIIVFVLVVAIFIGVSLSSEEPECFQSIDVAKVVADSNLLRNACLELAVRETEETFLLIGQLVRNGNGEYKKLFLRSAEMCAETIWKQICDDDGVSDEFFAYIGENPDTMPLTDIIESYLDRQNGNSKNIPDNYYFENETIPPMMEIQDVPKLTPKEFFEIRRKADGDSVGVYVIFNETKEMPYIGQAKRLLYRVNQHLTGHGNGEIFADYKAGDIFSVQILRLVDSGYSDLDKLERDLIAKFRAHECGYNRTKGNA